MTAAPGEAVTLDAVATPRPSGLRLRAGAGYALGVALSAFIVYTTLIGELPPLPQRAIPLSLASIMVFLLVPATRARPAPAWSAPLDLALIAGTLATGWYTTTQHEALAMRMGAYTTADALVSALGVVIVLELSRRTLGWPMTLIALAAIAYAFGGPYLPGELAHRGFAFVDMSVYLYLSQEGVFGLTLEVMVSLIFLFILFGAFLESSGAGDMMIALATAATRGVTGGPALASVASSGFFGTLSGSAVANVSGTGTYTIPLMKRTGYRPEFAGAVEAVASAGGAIMPPVMGAGAFLIAQYLGTSYGEVVVRAIVPAVLSYICLAAAVYLCGKRMGLRPAETSDVSVGRLLRRRGYLFLPLIGLVTFLVWGLSPAYAALMAWAMLLVLATAFAGPTGRLGPRRWLDGLVAAAKQSLSIFAVVATAGIVIGVVSLTGIGVKFSMAMVAAAGHSLLLGLVMVMLGSLVLGMGLPPIGAYVLTVVIAGSSLAQLGADLFAVHLFVFYFSALAVITPPVAIAAYTAAGIAGGEPFRTGFIATRLGLTGFIVPFMFVYGPPLLLRGSAGEIVQSILTALAGTLMLAVALEGYLLAPVAWWGRAMAAAGALALIKAGGMTDLGGFALLVPLLIVQTLAWRRGRRTPIPHGGARSW
jgi:TRAP transporter 4TM/12TM fusion protein